MHQPYQQQRTCIPRNPKFLSCQYQNSAKSLYIKSSHQILYFHLKPKENKLYPKTVLIPECWLSNRHWDRVTWEVAEKMLHQSKFLLFFLQKIICPTNRFDSIGKFLPVVWDKIVSLGKNCWPRGTIQQYSKLTCLCIHISTCKSLRHCRESWALGSCN